MNRRRISLIKGKPPFLLFFPYYKSIIIRRLYYLIQNKLKKVIFDHIFELFFKQFHIKVNDHPNHHPFYHLARHQSPLLPFKTFISAIDKVTNLQRIKGGNEFNTGLLYQSDEF
jgi:hypothetical protein